MNRFFALAIVAALAAGAVTIVAACSDPNTEECKDSVNECDTNTAVVCTALANGTHRIRRTPCLDQNVCLYGGDGIPTCGREPADDCPGSGQTCANNVISTCTSTADGGYAYVDHICDPGTVCDHADAGGFYCK